MMRKNLIANDRKAYIEPIALTFCLVVNISSVSESSDDFGFFFNCLFRFLLPPFSVFFLAGAEI